MSLLNKKKIHSDIAFLYERLSRDDDLEGESYSIDSFEGESEFAPIKNLFNEWYSRDISKKRRLSNKVKGSSGVPLGAPPYGY